MNKIAVIITASIVLIFAIMIAYFSKSAENQTQKIKYQEDLSKIKKDNQLTIEKHNTQNKLEAERKKEYEEKERETKEREEFNKNWHKHITQHSISFHADKILGGISNANVKVTNNSKSNVDEMILEARYIKRNNQNADVQNIKVDNLQPGETRLIRFPSSNRGINIDVEIIKCVVSEMGLNFNK